MKFGLILMPVLLISFEALSESNNVESVPTQSEVALVFKSKVPATCAYTVDGDDKEGGVIYSDEIEPHEISDFVKIKPITNTKHIVVSSKVNSHNFINNSGSKVGFDVWIGDNTSTSNANWAQRNQGNKQSISPGSEVLVVGLVNEGKLNMFKNHEGTANVTIKLSCHD
ncbi:hypothetical protein [Vibrio parahaemolyticus]|uniref:hypothetical protein n=1 Tax=Vibrio parahaemolyticus TaxID=670 RepID=UPI001E56EE9C|nr:hypothetical protein [Vibrio parahaemolyticus]